MTKPDPSRIESVTGVRLVPLTEAHLDAVLRHERQMFGPEAWSRDSYRAELRDTRLRHYVAAEDDAGALLGWAGLLAVADTGEILTVGTVPLARRRGIGRLLTQTLLAEAISRGCRQMFLEVRVDNPAARSLYESLGFTPMRTRRGYYEGGRVDALEMRRPLP